MNSIAYGRHNVDDEDIKSVVEVLRSDYLTMGSVTERFEKELADYTKTNGAVVVSSGTAALHCAYSTIELRGKEVITTPLSFVATASTAIHQGAKIIFCDVDPYSGNIDPAQVEVLINSQTAVITSVDYAGNPSQLSRLKKIAKKNNLFLFDDASHALGSIYKNNILGSDADLTIFSFFPTKNITSGEGGALVSNNTKLLEKARYFKMHGLVRDKNKQRNPEEGEWHQEVQLLGLNYRLSEIHAALALSQLKRVEIFKTIRKNIFKYYKSTLSSIAEIELPVATSQSDPFWHLYPVRVPKETRKSLFDYLRRNNIIVQVNYIPIYFHPIFADMGYRKGLCPIAEDYYYREISLPIHTKLSQNDLEKIVGLIHKFFK